MSRKTKAAELEVLQARTAHARRFKRIKKLIKARDAFLIETEAKLAHERNKMAQHHRTLARALEILSQS